MISRKIKNAAKTLSNIKHHVEPGVWKVMSRAVNELIESAEQVRVLEKKMRMANADSAVDIRPEMYPADVSDALETLAAVLRRAGGCSNDPAPENVAGIKSHSQPSLSLVPASEVKR